MIYIMVNQWVEFVKEYAKKNNISYGHAIKEAGPAYHSMKKRGKSTLRGKGLEDLPDELQNEIGDNLNINSLQNLASTNQGTQRNEYIGKNLQRKSNFNRMTTVANRLEQMFDDVMSTNDMDEFNEYYRTVVGVLYQFSIFQRDDFKFLNEQQRVSFRESQGNLQESVNLMNRLVYDNNRRRRARRARDGAP